jgi:hypothetical protein
MGYDYVPGALAGALALEQAGPGATRVDVGYYSLGAGPAALSAGTRESLVGVTLADHHAFRDGRVQSVRVAERVRMFRVRGRERAAVSAGGAEHFTLPPVHPALREVNVYIGWFGPLARPLQAGSLMGEYVQRLPGARSLMQLAGERLVEMVPGPEAGTTPGGISWIAAEAFGPGGDKLSELHLSGADGYDFTASFLAWACRRAAGEGVSGTGALGPVQAFGLRALEEGVRAAGIDRVRASAAAA